MATLAELQTLRDTAYQAYLDGMQAQTVSHNGRTVTTHQLESLRQAWLDAETQLRRAQSGTSVGVALADFRPPPL